MLWTTDEEVGSETSRAAIEEEAARSAAVLVLEPSLPGGAVKTSRKGCGGYQVTVRGVAAHAGIEPAEGRERRAGAGAPDPPRSTRSRTWRAASRSTSSRCPAACGPTSSRTRPAPTVDVRVPTAAAAAEVEAAFRGLRPVDAADDD